MFAGLNTSIYYLHFMTVISFAQDRAKTEILSDMQQVVVSAVYLLMLRKVTPYCVTIRWKILKLRLR